MTNRFNNFHFNLADDAKASEYHDFGPGNEEGVGADHCRHRDIIKANRTSNKGKSSWRSTKTGNNAFISRSTGLV